MVQSPYQILLDRLSHLSNSKHTTTISKPTPTIWTKTTWGWWRSFYSKWHYSCVYLYTSCCSFLAPLVVLDSTLTWALDDYWASTTRCQTDHIFESLSIQPYRATLPIGGQVYWQILWGVRSVEHAKRLFCDLHRILFHSTMSLNMWNCFDPSQNSFYLWTTTEHKIWPLVDWWESMSQYHNNKITCRGGEGGSPSRSL